MSPLIGPSVGPSPSATALGLSQDAAIRDSLLVIAEDIAEHAGFGAVVMSVRHSAAELKVVAVAGDPRVHRSLFGSVMPVGEIVSLLQLSQPWGDLRFIEDAAAHPAAGTGRWSWMDDATAASPHLEDSPSAWSELPWQRENALVAPMVRDDGEILGLVSVDLPSTGLRPRERQRLILSVYARQAERTIMAAERRIHETHQLRLAQAARQIVRDAGLQDQVAELLPKARTALMDNLGLQQAWIKSTSLTSPTVATAAPRRAEVSPLMAPAAGEHLALLPQLLAPLSRAAQQCWNAQSVVELSRETTSVPGMSDVDLSELLEFLSRHGVASALVVPLGSGEVRLGSMILGRSENGRAWSEAEKAIALDIGHDLGRAMIHTLWFEAQLLASEELRQSAEHRRQLMMSMSHELQTPLASIRAHVELIEPDLNYDPTITRALRAIDRGADRLTKLVNNMIWLSRVDDPHRQVDTEFVDVVEAVRAVVEDATSSGAVTLAHPDVPGSASADGVRRLTLRVPDAPVWVEGTRSELILMCCNLVANAVKYTDEDGLIVLEVFGGPGIVEVVVHDNGIGVAEHERALIFDDFYRSSSAAARRRSGTGLGLSIVKRIVARHGGRISVEPAVPGTVFRVCLVADSAAAKRDQLDR